MVRLIDKALANRMFCEDVAVHSGNKVLMEFGKNNVPIVGDP
jgi:hypothetical protein